MAIKPYQAIATPVGHFDVLDIDSASIKGGEVLVFDRVDGNDVEYATQDVLANDGYRAQMRLAGPLDVGPFFLAANEDRPSSNTGFENTNLYGTNAAYSQTIDGSGKASLFADNGFYAISSDVIDTDTITINTPVYTKLYPNANGYLTTTPNLTDECVGFFIEYQLGSALRGRPGSLYYPGTHKTGDTLIVYKSSGYPSADEDGDGYEDGYVWADHVRMVSSYDVVASDTVEGAIEEISDYLVANLGRPEYLDPASTVTIYVRETGDDGYGDGTLANPYRQPQRALRDIPALAVGAFYIDHGPGIFETPSVDILSGSGNLFIILVGDRSDPAITLTAPVWTKVAGKNSQYQTTVPAYADVVGDGTHWAFRDLIASNNLAPRAYLSLASTSPDFRVEADSSPSTTTTVVYPFTTIFVSAVAGGARGYHCSFPQNVSQTRGPICLFMGIRFQTAAETAFSGFGFDACRFDNQTTVGNAPVIRVMASSHLTIFGIKNRVAGSLVLGNFHVVGSSTITGLTTRGTNAGFGQMRVGPTDAQGLVPREARSLVAIETGSVSNGGWDAEGTVVCAIVENASVFLQNAPITTVNSPSFLSLKRLSVYTRVSSTVTGSTAGVCVVMESGSQAEGLEAACNGTLTNSAVPGDEIQIGSTTTPADAFIDLPISDAASFCRAT